MIVLSGIKRCQLPHSTQIFQKAKLDLVPGPLPAASALAPLLRVELRVLRGERVEQVRRGVVLLLRVRLGGAKEQGAVLLGRLELERSILDKFESKEHQHPLQIPEIIMPIS